MAHGSWNDATYSDGSFGMDRWLVNVSRTLLRQGDLLRLRRRSVSPGFPRVSGRRANGLTS